MQTNFVFPFKICAYFAFLSIIGKTFYNPGRVTDLVVSQIEHERLLIHFSWTGVGDQLTSGTGNTAYLMLFDLNDEFLFLHIVFYPYIRVTMVEFLHEFIVGSAL